MNKQILSILTCMILISIVAIPAIGIEISSDASKPNYFKSNSGCLEGFKPDLIAEYKIVIEQPIIKSISFNDDLISLVQQLDEELYLGYLENLTDFGPRVTGTPACDSAGDYIYDQFVSMGLDAEYHYWEIDDLWAYNIVATFNGTDTSSDEEYIICAHYDSVENSPGADDDGSGTAAVLSAANIMRNAEFNHTIKFITFSGEEQGLLGSYSYAQEAAQNGDNIIAVFNLDMIGYVEILEDATKMRIYDKEDISTWITDFVESIAIEYETFFGLEILRPGYSWGSDHHYFIEYGYDAIFGAESHFNPNWHTPDDTIDNLDISYAVRISQLIIASLAELSGFITLNAPYIPDRPSGPPGGKIDVEYTYTAQTTDPQSDQILYLFDWGDGTDSGWIGPYASGDTAEASHIWTKTKTYEIKVKAKDTNNYESDWSEPLEVNMPRNKAINIFLLKLLERFPFLEQLLLLLLK
jgi:hypothetical protein